MKTLGAVLLSLFILQSCFYRPYYKDSDWWYLEDWDTNQDRVIDKGEFILGFEKHHMVKKINRLDSLATKGYQKLSEPELASAMFAIADTDKDDKLSALEFYKWEVYL